MMNTPNLVSETVKIGKDETENREIRRFMEPTKFAFTPLDHAALGEKLDILDLPAPPRLPERDLLFTKVWAQDSKEL